MLRGLYTAAAGMLASQVSTDTLASNLANVNTVGFKANKLNFQTFSEMLISKVDANGQDHVGSVATGSKVFESFINFAPGPMQATGNTFDLAINGDGFFTVKSPDTGETYYTRAGNFTIDQDGFLTTVSGEYVQGKLGNIQLQLDQGPFTVSRQGEIAGKGRTIDQLEVTRFADNNMLEKYTDNLYQATKGSKTVSPAPGSNSLGYAISSGTLESSNVNPVAELVNNIQGMRLYEALQKNIHMQNDALGKTVNDVGRMSR